MSVSVSVPELCLPRQSRSGMPARLSSAFTPPPQCALSHDASVQGMLLLLLAFTESVIFPLPWRPTGTK